MQTVTLLGPRGLRIVAEVATGWQGRTRGLRGRVHLPPGRGLLIRRARSVHTFGMRFPIKVAFLGRDSRVVSVRDLPPRRIALPRLRARHMLECPTATDVRVGDRLILQAAE